MNEALLSNLDRNGKGYFVVNETVSKLYHATDAFQSPFNDVLLIHLYTVLVYRS